MLAEYKAFLLRGNLVQLATAFILGVAFNAIVQALANDVIMGTIAQWIGLDNLAEMTIGPVLVGTFVGALLSFVIVATVLFFVVRAAARFQREEEQVEAAAVPDPEDVLLLREIRDLLASQRTV